MGPGLDNKRKTRGNQTDGEYVCDKCEYTSDKKKNLGYHEKAVHLKLKRYKCSACLHISYLKRTLQIHVKRKHKDDTCRIIKIGCSPCENNLAHEFCERSKKHKTQNGKLKCSECDFTSNLQRKLTVHNEVVHKNLKRYKCSACLHAS